MPKTAGELTRSRRDAARMLTASCTIKRPSETLTDDGYPTDSEATVASGVSCRLVATQMNPWEQRSGGEVRALDTYTVLLPWDTSIDATDVVEIGSRRFEVTGRTEPQTDEVLLRVHVSELT